MIVQAVIGSGKKRRIPEAEPCVDTLLMAEMSTLHASLFPVANERPNLNDCTHTHVTLNRDDWFVCLMCAKTFECAPNAYEVKMRERSVPHASTLICRRRSRRRH